MTFKLLTPVRCNNNREFYIYKEYFNMFKKIDTDLIIVYFLCDDTLTLLTQIADGLLLTGGKDIDAAYFKQDNHQANHFEPKQIDELEFKLIDIFTKNNKPVFGICRGIQILNVYFGGTLIQDIPSTYFTPIIHQQNKNNQYCHHINVVENTTLAKYISNHSLVNSYHHQCIDKLGNNLIINAYSEDGLIEGIENETVLAVQWHPEKCDDHVQEGLLKLIYSRLSRLMIF